MLESVTAYLSSFNLSDYLTNASSLQLLGIALVSAVLVVGFEEAILKPFAIKVYEKLLFKNLSRIFDRINPQMPVWIDQGDAEGVKNNIEKSIAEVVEEFENYPKWLRVAAVNHLETVYKPSINAQKIDDAFKFEVQTPLTEDSF